VRLYLLTLCLSVSSACAAQSGVQKQQLERGVFQLDCSMPLGRCSEEADRICDGRGYDVVEGYDQRKLYGHAAGESQVEVRSSRLVISCRDARGESTAPKVAPSASLPEGQRPQPRPAASKPSPPKASVCTPGGTQRCVGPGACEGGQSCLPDGSGYGACDCGKATAAPLSPAPTP
jgi:hypothetical protein